MDFEKELGIGYDITDTARVLQIIANRYVADNPPIPFTFRGFSRASAVSCGHDGSYRIDFSSLFPEAPRGAYAYVATRIFAKQDGPHGLFLTTPGGTELYIDGNPLYRSSVRDEQSMGRKNLIETTLQRGWHDIFIKCKNVCPGQFWIAISGNSPKWAPMLFYSPFLERAGQIGFASTGWVSYDVFEEIPDLSESETNSPAVTWYPVQSWADTQRTLPPCKRLFGTEEAMAWSKIRLQQKTTVHFTIHSAQNLLLYVGGQKYTAGQGPLQADVALIPGEYDVLVCGREFSVETDAPLSLPNGVRGVPGPWLYAGPLADKPDFSDPAAYCTLYRLFAGKNGSVYWCADLPHMAIRPCLENTAFGKWSYPHGVTLYGLLEAARMLGRQDLINYCISHAAECVRLYPYSRWDRETYGYPNINQQLLWFSALDDVGSFGSFVLETSDGVPSEYVRQLSDDIAAYMRAGVERTPEGGFFRLDPSCEQTMWADDLYMSVPFLVRYATLFNDSASLDDAARQFLVYKKYLYMEDEHLFSHVYDFRRGSQSHVPWGRGNGWALFSLSELLLKMPKIHALYNEIVAFFREFSQGILSCQGKHGLWHQVLHDPTTYEETSCTAMIICAFSRGIRLGLLDAKKFTASVFRAWNGLLRYAIDKTGNVHGVCRGSFYSFDPEYYRTLGPVTNDPHGVGIVLLAGVETLRLQDALSKE